MNCLHGRNRAQRLLWAWAGCVCCCEVWPECVIQDHFTGWLSCVRWDHGQILCKCGQSFTRKYGRGTTFSSYVSIPKRVCLPMLGFVFFIIINICLHWCQFGQENRRKNQGLLTTRSPCDTTFHSIKEVKVLLPWVWFTREKEREKVVMLLHYWERQVREQGATTPGATKTLIKQIPCSPQISHADQPWERK